MIPAESGLSVTFPENFREMSAEEIRNAFNDGFPLRWGIWDEAGHMIVVLQWNKAGGIASKLWDIKAVCRSDEKSLSKLMKDRGYSLGSFFGGTVCGTELEGFDYSYDAEGIRQSAKLMVFRNGRKFYKLYYYSRSECDDANRKVLEGIMGTMAFTDS